MRQSGLRTHQLVAVTIDGRRIENAATLIGDAYSAATGDRRGSVVGRLIDKGTDAAGIDVNVDLDRMKITVTRKGEAS